MKPVVIAAAFALMAAAALGVAPVQPAAAAVEGAPSAPCFMSRNWTGTKALDEHKMLIGVGLSSVYEVEFAQGCSKMDEPWAKFISTTHGTGAICSPIDINLRVSTIPGFSTSCIATGLRKLSAEEVAALPRNQRP